MAKDNIMIDTKRLDRLAIELKGFEDQVGEAGYHAINRTIDFVYTQIGRIVPQSYAVKAKDVKGTLKKGKVSATNLTGHIESKGHTLSFAHFPHSPQAPYSKRRSYTVKVAIKKGARKPVTTEPKAFLAPTGAMNPDKTQYNVFRRIGANRLPIMVIRTLSIPQMIQNEGVADKLMGAAQEKFNERIEHEIIYRMTNIAKKVNR